MGKHKIHYQNYKGQKMINLYAKRWKLLESFVNKIQDEVLRGCYLGFFQQRAVEEWGFCPRGGKYTPVVREITLSPTEKDFVDRINAAIQYEVYIPPNKINYYSEMTEYIENGGTFSGLPEQLQNDSVWNLYQTCMEKLIDEFWEKSIFELTQEHL